MAWAACFIVVVELCERLCFYTFSGTMKSWLQDRGYSNAESSSLTQIFSLLAYVSCFLGGWMADTRVGRYRTIWSLVLLYTGGCFLSAVATHPDVMSVPMFLISTLVLIALGTGGIKPNVGTFGADQFDAQDPDSDKKKESFFMYFYLAVNIGALIAYAGVDSIPTNGLGSLVSLEDGYFAAYIVAACSMGVAFFVFVGATPLYRKESFETNEGSVLSFCVRRLLDGRGHPRGKIALVGWALIPVLIIVAVVNAFVDTWIVTVISLVIDVLCVGCLCVAHYKNDWLGDDEFTKSLNGIPRTLIGGVSFNVLYNSMTGLFYSESCQMDTRLGSSKDASQLSGAFFNLGDCFGVIVFTPLIDKVFLPMAARVLGREVGLSAKIYTGLFFGMAAQVAAAVIEYGRLAAGPLPIGSNCAPLEENGEHVHMSDLSAFWMLLPYSLVGIGEVFVNPVIQHFAYAETSPYMRSLMQAFTLFAIGGIPGAFSSSLTQATAGLVTNNLDDGNLPVAYFINAGCGLVGMVLFYVVSPSSQSSHAEGDAAVSKTSAIPADSNLSSAAPPASPVILGREHVSPQSHKEESA